MLSPNHSIALALATTRRLLKTAVNYLYYNKIDRKKYGTLKAKVSHRKYIYIYYLLYFIVTNFQSFKPFTLKDVLYYSVPLIYYAIYLWVSLLNSYLTTPVLVIHRYLFPWRLRYNETKKISDEPYVTLHQSRTNGYYWKSISYSAISSESKQYVTYLASDCFCCEMCVINM